MTNKKIRPAPIKPTWGATLSPVELAQLMDRLEKKRKDREMSKMTESLARALEKKQAKTHPASQEIGVIDTKVRKIRTAPPIGKKPPTKSAGRGR